MSRTVLAVGVFDILHYGHIRHLQAAARLGSALHVGITRDRSIHKGPGRPVQHERHRLAIVRALRFVRFAFLCDSSLQALRKVKPSIFALGSDYAGRVLVEDMEYCDEHGIRIVHTREPRMSSTEIYDRIRKGC